MTHLPAFRGNRADVPSPASRGREGRGGTQRATTDAPTSGAANAPSSFGERTDSRATLRGASERLRQSCELSGRLTPGGKPAWYRHGLLARCSKRRQAAVLLPEILGAPLRRRALPAHVARGNGGARLGFLRCDPRHRRRLYRPSQLRHGDRRPRCWRRRGFASASSRSPIGATPTPSRRWESRTCSSASPPATWIRWSTATPRTGGCGTMTPTRRAARAANGRTAPSSSMRSAAARRFPKRRSCSAASRRRCAASPITITGRTRCAAPSCSTPRPICCSMATPSARWSRSRIASPRGGLDQDFSDIRGLAFLRAATPEGWTEAPADDLDGDEGTHVRRRGDVVVRLPSFEQVARDPEAYARASRVLHRESNPGNARPLTQRHGDRDVWLTRAAHSADDAGDGRRFTTCPSRARRIPPMRARKSRPGR